MANSGFDVSAEEAVRAVHKAVDEVLSDPQAFNTPVTSLRIPEDLRAWIQQKAEAENRSMGNWIITRLRELQEAERGRKRK